VGGTGRPAGEAYSIMYVETGGRSGPSRMARCIRRRQGYGGSGSDDDRCPSGVPAMQSAIARESEGGSSAPAGAVPRRTSSVRRRAARTGRARPARCIRRRQGHGGSGSDDAGCRFGVLATQAAI